MAVVPWSFWRWMRIVSQQRGATRNYWPETKVTNLTCDMKGHTWIIWCVESLVCGWWTERSGVWNISWSEKVMSNWLSTWTAIRVTTSPKYLLSAPKHNQTRDSSAYRWRQTLSVLVRGRPRESESKPFEPCQQGGVDDNPFGWKVTGVKYISNMKIDSSKVSDRCK